MHFVPQERTDSCYHKFSIYWKMLWYPEPVTLQYPFLAQTGEFWDLWVPIDRASWKCSFFMQQEWWAGTTCRTPSSSSPCHLLSPTTMRTEAGFLETQLGHLETESQQSRFWTSIWHKFVALGKLTFLRFPFFVYTALPLRLILLWSVTWLIINPQPFTSVKLLPLVLEVRWPMPFLLWIKCCHPWTGAHTYLFRQTHLRLILLHTKAVHAYH